VLVSVVVEETSTQIRISRPKVSVRSDFLDAQTAVPRLQANLYFSEPVQHPRFSSSWVCLAELLEFEGGGGVAFAIVCIFDSAVAKLVVCWG